MKLVSLEDLNRYLFSNTNQNLKHSSDKEFQLLKFAAHLKQIGSPEQDLNIIHIAGTSGKGSTVTILAKLLLDQGFRTGHIVSPHIQSINERFQINCKPISTDKLLWYASQVCIPDNDLTFFEKITALQFYIFSHEKPDYIILETGIGGRLDSTNIPVTNKICVLNTIGLDHTEYLGNTLVEIAREKAGIIQEGNQAVALSQQLNINKVFTHASSSKNAKLDYIKYDYEIQNIVQKSESLSFDYTDLNQTTHSLAVSMLGKYQAGNTALALRAMEHAAIRGNWIVDWKTVENSLQKISFPGRFETIKTNNDYFTIIDGAHNPQKMEAFLSNVISIYTDTKFTLVIAIKNGKDSGGVLETISRRSLHINKIILTTFSGILGLSLISIPTSEMKNDLIRFGFRGKIIETKDLQEVFKIIDLTKNNYIFTGSLYILGTIRSEFGLV